MPFVSHEADRCTLSVLLADKSGASLEGVQVRINAWKRHGLEDLTANLETMHEGRFICISRVDCQPRGPHANKHWRRFSCPATVNGTHFHPFSENAQIGREAFHPTGNLPVARSVDDEPQSYREFLRLVSRVFVIKGLDDLPTPPTQEGWI